MKKLLIAFSACLLVNAHAEQVQCPVDQSRPVTSIRGLPDDIQLLLGRGNSGVSGIADASEAFNPTDVMLAGEVLPMSRFSKASLSDDCARVVVERGGRGHGFEIQVFRKEKLAWRLIDKRAPSAEELRTLMQEHHAP
jgi:hypothetical protein